MKLLVCSFGGVASKSFIKGVTAAGQQPLPWHHGHYRNPPIRVDDDVRVVYLFGNPFNAIISFFNRRRFRSRLHGFGDQEDLRPDFEWALNHCKNINGDWQSLDPAWGLEEYLANGKDLFGLEDHFNKWATARRPYPILLLKYETLWNNLGPCLQFLGIPEYDLTRFPAKQKRGSDWQSLSAPKQEKLYSIYGKLYEQIEAFDDFKIVQAT